MQWVLGLDLRPRSTGAIRLCSWLRDNSLAPDGERFAAVHVLEESHLLVVLRYQHLAEVVDGARASASKVLAAEGLNAEVEVIQAISPEEGLEAARANRRADGIVIGRTAGRDAKGIVRLGRVARRLLRSAKGPVVVTPPDLELQHLGIGPLVALTNLKADSIAACRFAASLAGRLGRELAVVHLAPDPEESGLSHLLPRSLDSIRAEFHEQAERGLQEWMAAAGIGPATTAVLQGPLVDILFAFVDRRSVPLIVCGSRRLSALERTIQHSTGAELAGTAPVPVAVVPS